jgi:RHS repeat-associated protein
LSASYDNRGFPREIQTEGATLLSIPEYTPSGQPKRATYRNGVADTWSYEPVTLRLTSAVTRQKTGAAILSYDYQYDANNNPTTITRVDGPQPLGINPITKTYGYDSLDRLELARYEGIEAEPLRYGYSYSPAGNILVKDDAFYHYEGEDPQAVTERMSLLKGGAESYGYDRDGNMTSASTPEQSWSYAWDGEGRLASAVPAEGAEATFRYGPQGERLLKRSKSEGGGYADLYLGALELRGSDALDGGQVAGYYNVSLGAVNVQLALRLDINARLVRDPAADRTYHKDHLGSTALVTASDGSITSETGDAGRLEYAPYGEELLTDAGARRIHIRYTGKETDDETDLTYYGARYANAKLGRWISRDPAAIELPEASLKTSQFANLYSFAENNPARHVDPDGKAVPVVLAACAASGACAAFLAAAGAYVASRFVPTTMPSLPQVSIPVYRIPAPKTFSPVDILEDKPPDYVIPKEEPKYDDTTPNTVDQTEDTTPTKADEYAGSRGGPGAGRPFPDRMRKERRDKEPPCTYCGTKTTKDKGQPNSYEGDHGVPKSKGGNDTPINLKDSCRTCNRTKSDKMPDGPILDLNPPPPAPSP